MTTSTTPQISCDGSSRHIKKTQGTSWVGEVGGLLRGEIPTIGNLEPTGKERSRVTRGEDYISPEPEVFYTHPELSTHLLMTWI
jgi:hypothetical protein